MRRLISWIGMRTLKGLGPEAGCILMRMCLCRHPSSVRIVGPERPMLRSARWTTGDRPSMTALNPWTGDIHPKRNLPRRGQVRRASGISDVKWKEIEELWEEA